MSWCPWEATEGAGAPPPPHRSEDRGDPQPRPERRKGEADDPAERGRGLSKTRPFVEGHRGPQPPPTPARRRAGGGRVRTQQKGGFAEGARDAPADPRKAECGPAPCPRPVCWAGPGLGP